jgi:hypothetical protein
MGLNRGISPGNNLMTRLGLTTEIEKTELDSYVVERQYKQSILKHLLKGIVAKGSGLGENSGKYTLKLNQNCQDFERLDIDSKKKETKKVITIDRVVFNFEYKDTKSGQIKGVSTIDILFIDKVSWEFKTPRKSKNTFYSSLVHFRLNIREFVISALTN